jgi:hypothetical protein
VVVPLGRGGTVLINTRFADIKVTGWDEDKVEAVATGDASVEKIEATVAGPPGKQRLTLNAGAYGPHRPLMITVKVPKYADLETYANSNGDVEVTNLDGAVRLGSGQGDATIDGAGTLKILRRHGDIAANNVKGDVSVDASHGDIAINNVARSVEIAAATGDIAINKAGGDVRVSSSTGDINVNCVTGRVDARGISGSIGISGVGGDVDAETTSGDVIVKAPLRMDGTYRLRSVSGDVEISLPADIPGFTVVLNTYSGGMDFGFPVRVSGPLNGGPVNKKITGVYGDGRAKLFLDSFSSEVRIVKGATGLSKACK